MRISKVSKFVAGALAGVLLVAGFGGAALAAPSDVSEARGQFIRTNSTVLDGLLAARGATAEYPSGTYPVANQPLTGAILQQIVGQLEGSSAIGSSGVLTLGAASQYAQALPDGTARAGSGAVTSVNGLILGGTGAPGANASLNLTPLISRAGASTALSQAQLSLGALGSTIESQGGTVTSDYLIGDAGITLTSPLVSGVYNQLRTQVTGLQTSVDNLETAARTSILNYLNGLNAGVLRATATVDVTEPNLTALLPTGSVGSGTGVSVNLSTGQVVIDLKQLLASD
ncbi:MAG: choice-of-anchor G family protein, partial [Microbacteriaceae bacterium]